MNQMYEPKQKIAFTGSRDLSSVYNTEHLRHIFRSLFALAYGDIMSDAKCHLLVGDCPGMDEIAQRVASNHFYPIKTTVHSVGEPRIHLVGDLKSDFKSYKERDRAMIDECEALVAIRINKSSGTSRNIAYAEKLGRRVLLADL